MKLFDLVMKKMHSIENESNSILKLYKSFELYEFMIKLEVSYLLNLYKNITPMDKDQKYIKNICKILKFQFQYPGMGNWIALLRDLQKLNLHNEKEANIDGFVKSRLGKINN